MSQPSPRRRVDGLIPRRVDSPVAQRGYAVGPSNYNGVTPADYARLQSELEREQRRRLAAEKTMREFAKRGRRLEEKHAMDQQAIDKLKWKLSEQQTIVRDFLFQNKEKDGYISRLQHESDGLRRRLSDVASGLPQSIEQEFMQLRNENKRLQHKCRNLMVAFEEERLHRDREVQELLEELRLAAHEQKVLMVDCDRSERQVRKMMDWMHSMKAEVVELKRAQDEEIRSGALSPASSITSIPNFVQMLEQSNPFRKAEDMLDMMKSYQPTDAATDTTSEVQSIPTEQLDVWSVGDPSERGSDDGRWPTFDDDTGSVRKAAKNIEDRLAYVDNLLECDEHQAEEEAQEGLLDFRLLRLHDDQVLFDAVRKNLAQIRQRKQIKTPDHRTRKSVLDFLTQGGYYRYGAEEEDALRAFDFLDTILLGGQNGEKAAERSATSAVTCICEETPCSTLSPLPPASIASPMVSTPASGFAFTYSEKETKKTATGGPGDDSPGVPARKISHVDDFGKATTPELSQLRKLAASGSDNTGHPPESLFGTPGVRKRVIVRASSTLVEDMKNASAKKKRPKSMIFSTNFPQRESDSDTPEPSPGATTVDVFLPKMRGRAQSDDRNLLAHHPQPEGRGSQFNSNKKRNQSVPTSSAVPNSQHPFLPRQQVITTEL